MDFFSAFILGLVEGITEFLPVSSTGHLIIVNDLLGVSGPTVESFDIIIQLGAILAVVLLYWKRFVGLIPFKSVRTALEQGENGGFSGFRGLWLLFLTCLPAGILGFLAHGFIKERLFHPLPVCLALLSGALLMLLLERFKPRARFRSLDEFTPKLALGIGLCQCCSLWPGFSRSASTIMGGMLLGADRKTAADYSFIAAVPIMFAATGYELYKNFSVISGDVLPVFIFGFLVSFFSAWLAVKAFISLVGRLGLAPFAWYRLVLAPLVYWFMVN